MNGTLAASVTGWNAWLMNPLIMEKLTEEELRDLSTTFERLAIEFLNLDLKYTAIIKKQRAEAKAKKIEVLKEKAQTEAKIKAVYVT